ncbi:hypothetical protein E3U43_010278 [Larimichthys crocea]|uniref:Uncharacterized protein n=1 Tax=Larimichthys crocea TaxID=215358 RepID=A0ACD3RF25_LARCR|nr:hypothetical protein E3U43_010278 [Larimichthys crocea]
MHKRSRVLAPAVPDQSLWGSRVTFNPFKKRPPFCLPVSCFVFQTFPTGEEPKTTDGLDVMLPYFVLLLLSRSDRASEKVFIPTHTHTHTHTSCKGVGCTTTTTVTTATEKERSVGYYFGLWARCLNDELKKKICNDCHVASS